MRTATANVAIERSLSKARLEKYLFDAGTDLDIALTLYERNARLSEAFYWTLQSVEVCLRNHVSEALRLSFGNEWLFGGAAPFGPDALSEVRAASAKVGDEIEGKVVAELRFAFWVSLLARRYDATLWRRGLHAAFRQGRAQPRSVVHGRVNMIRRFRNRVAHHEPIYRLDLERIHTEIVECIGWMCPDTAAWTAHHSRLPAVLAGQIR